MTPGGRRALVALVLVAGLLIGGRSLAGFLADRWWLEAAAPEALPFFVRRSVLRGLLDLGATAFATLWWMGNLLALLRASHAPGSGIGGNPAIRRAFNHRDARLWAFVVALALGALMGVGASTWADPLLLARQGVRFGMPEPSLALDIGILVGSLPAWLRVHAFLTLLVLTTLGVTLAGQLLAGTLRIGRGRLIITDAARWHLGLLLAMLAAVIAVHQILTPYELAAGIPRPVEPGVVLLHRSVAFVLVGVSLAVIGLSVLWGLRPIHSLAAGSWLAFTLALLAAYYFLPSGAAWPSTPEERVTRERLERLGYGLEPREDSSAGRALRPSLWDPDLVAALVTGDTLPPATAVRRPAVSAGEGGGGGGERPAWVGLRTEPTGETALLVVADDTAGAGGRPLFQRPAILGGGVGIEARPAAILPALSPRPNSTGVVVADGDVGVPPGSWPRRLVLSWVLQSTGPLQADRRVGWLLDPTDRLRHAAPFASWSSTALVESAGRWVWLGVGFVSAEAFPGTRKQPWLGRRVSYLRPGLVGTVDAVTGRLQIFVAHETDSLSAAWARVAGGLVRPADRLPAWLTDALDYPRMWLELHADLWMQTEAERLGRPTVELGAGAASPVPGGWAIPITDQRPGRLHAVLEGRRVGPRMELLVHRPDTLGLEAADVLERRWARFPAFQLLRDSVTAAGAQFESGNVRYVAGSEGLLAYRPSWGLRPGGEAALIMVAVARRNLVGVGRTFEDALQRLRGGDATLVSPAEGESAILFEARRWLREADSALRRGDLTAFARAFAALRTLLEGTEGR